MVLIIPPIYASSSCSCERPAFFANPNSKKVLKALYMHDGELLTAEDIAKITELDKCYVQGILISIQKKNLCIYTYGKIKLENGSYQIVKFLSLTPEGKKFAKEIL